MPEDDQPNRGSIAPTIELKEDAHLLVLSGSMWMSAMSPASTGSPACMSKPIVAPGCTLTRACQRPSPDSIVQRSRVLRGASIWGGDRSFDYQIHV